MLHHVLSSRSSVNPTNKNSLDENQSSRRTESLPRSIFLPRYHYSRMNSEPKLFRGTTSIQDNSNRITTTIIPIGNSNESKKDFIQIPITREDNQSKSVPITYINETTTLTPLQPQTNSENQSKPNLINFLRPNSRYSQYHQHRNDENHSTNRRTSLVLPVLTNQTEENETTKSTIRSIPIRFPYPVTAASIPSNNFRMSSAILRSVPISPPQLQRQKTDLNESSTPLLNITVPTQTSSSDFTISSPIRRAEVLAREAIQGLARLQQQRNKNYSRIRSPSTTRRVIINLQNNQSVALDSRLSSASKSPTTRTIQRNNLYYIPLLHEIQLPNDDVLTDVSSNQLSSAGVSQTEYQIEIPISIDKRNGDEENLPEQNQRLKSILKRSSSRDTVQRKNVSFMNA